jgi:glycerate dehydrogenase
MKAVVLDGYTLNPGDLSWDELGRICEFTVYDRTPKELTLERIGDAEIIITNKTLITREILEKAPHIKYVGVLATGYNVVDLEAASELKIPVTNVPAYSTNSVAQLVFAFILEICHRVADHSEAVKQGDWTNCKDFSFWNYPLMELEGKTLGIIGFGSIGIAVSKIALSFGMKVITYSRTIKKEYENEDLRFVSLEELYKEADIISLHTPLSEETKGLINQTSLNQMKDGVILINTSRGGLIVEQDLKDALESGKVYAAAVDVTTVEPIPANSPLLTAKNIFITPHIGWAPKEARTRLITVAIDNVRQFVTNKPQNVVNTI